MHWSEVQNGQPGLADLGRQRLLEPGVVLVATIRNDGTPRISPVEPFVMDGDLWLSMLWESRKAADLLRDPRVLVHSVVTGRDGGEGEFKIRGTAVAEQDPEVQGRYARQVASTLGWDPEPGRFHLFAVSIDNVTFIRYDDATGSQHVAMWPPAREFIRRGTSATSVGEPQAVSEIIASPLSNEISRARIWEARLQQRPVGQHSLSQALGSLLADRAPAGSPAAELLMGCRARLGVST